MWSSTNQRIKALISARAREKDRLTRPIHVRRADAVFSFRNAEDFLIQIPGRILLNDLNSYGFFAYAGTPLNPNSELTVEIEHPKRFRLSAKVVWCQYQPSSSHILTAQAFPYRIGIALIWKKPELEAEFKKYCEDLSGLYVNAKALFLEEAFKTDPDSEPKETVAASAPLPEVPPPTESDEGGAPSDEKIAEEAAAAVAAEVAAEVASKALDAANSVPTQPNVETPSASEVLNTLKEAA